MSKIMRRYSDRERCDALIAVAANHGDVRRTAKELGIPYWTLMNWYRGTRHPEARALAEEASSMLADRLEEMAHLVLDELPDKVPEASVDHLNKLLANVVEKMRLLREQPTAIGKVDGDMTDDELDRRIAAAEAELAALAGTESGENPPEEQRTLPE